MSKQLANLRGNIEKAWNDDGTNKNYFIGLAKKDLTELDKYVTMLENSVAVMSATLNEPE